MGDRWSISAHLLSWIYITDRPELKGVIFQSLCDDIGNIDYTPSGDLPAWFFDSLPEVQQRQDCVRSFRSSLLSRNGDESLFSALLDVFDLLQTPRMQDGLQPWRKHGDNPVFWCMKALQRQLCIFAGGKWEGEVVFMGISCIS